MSERDQIITDEVEWHEIINNPVIYIEDAGLDGVLHKFVAHYRKVETPGIDEPINEDLDDFEMLCTLCDKCLTQAFNDAAELIFPTDLS